MEEGNRSQEASSLAALADTHIAAGDREHARRAWHDALAILDELSHPDAARTSPAAQYREQHGHGEGHRAGDVSAGVQSAHEV